MTVSFFTDVDGIPPELSQTLSVRSGVAFFKSIEWFACLAKNGLPAERLRIYIAHNDDQVQSALYCVARGRKLESLTNFYSIEYGPVMERESARQGFAAIVSQIAAERPRWTTIDLRNLHDSDLALMRSELEAAGFATHAWKQHINWFLDVVEPFDEYYANLTTQLRSTIQRKSRKAKKKHTVRLAVYPGEDLSLNQAIDHYETVYAASWKAAEPFPEFMPALFKTCDKLGLVRVGLAWVDDEPAAAQIWINDGNSGRVFIYKLAYEERFGEMSIGSILSKKLFEHAIDIDKVKEIDYGVGDERYKRDWMGDSRQLSGLLACNRRTLTGQLRNMREIIASYRHR